MDCYLYVQISESSLIGIVLAGTTAILLFVVSIILFVTLYNKKRLVLEETAKRQAAEYDIKLQAGRVAETERIIRELSRTFHDHMGSKLAFLVTVLGDLCNRHRRQQPLSADHLHLGRQLAKEVMENLRQLSHVMEGTTLLEHGLLHAVQAEVALIKRFSELDVNLLIESGCYDAFDPETALHIFRIIQESITNVLKHAQADTLRLCFGMTDAKRLQVSIEDNGRGFDLDGLDEAATLGLGNMHFRAECTGGKLSIDSHRGSGTHVSLTVPIATP